MKKRTAGMMLLTSMMLLVMLGGCGETAVEPTPETNAPEAAVAEAAAPAPEAASSRIDELLKAWSDAGLKSELRQEHRSNTINSMYGTVRHYEVLLNDHMVIVLEFEPENLDSTGKRVLENVEQKGTLQRTGEKAWRSGEFVLTSQATRIENGTAVEKYDLTKHPELEKIIATFTAFK